MSPLIAAADHLAAASLDHALWSLGLPTSDDIAFARIVGAADALHEDNDRDETVTWESLRVGQWITLPDGADGMVVGRTCRTDEDGTQHRIVSLKPDRGPIFPYQWDDEAGVTYSEPF